MGTLGVMFAMVVVMLVAMDSGIHGKSVRESTEYFELPEVSKFTKTIHMPRNCEDRLFHGQYAEFFFKVYDESEGHKLLYDSEKAGKITKVLMLENLVIEGLLKGMVGMCIGEKRLIGVHSVHGYKNKGFGGYLKKNQNFLAEVYLVSSSNPNQHWQQDKMDVFGYLPEAKTWVTKQLEEREAAQREIMRKKSEEIARKRQLRKDKERKERRKREDMLREAKKNEEDL